MARSLVSFHLTSRHSVCLFDIAPARADYGIGMHDRMIPLFEEALVASQDQGTADREGASDDYWTQPMQYVQVFELDRS